MILKWLFDRTISLDDILFLWPALLVVALRCQGALLLSVQVRVGKGGFFYNCYKFRTMTDKHKGSTASVAGDSRIIPLGAKQRLWKLDELPVLGDVLIGK